MPLFQREGLVGNSIRLFVIAAILFITIRSALLKTDSQLPDYVLKPQKLIERNERKGSSQFVLSDAYSNASINPPLRTRGRHIVDSTNNVVKLKSVNWYGASDIYYIPSGLDKQPRDKIAALIRDIGFNSVRIPYSDEMVVNNPPINASQLAANLDLVEAGGGVARALDVFTAVVESLTAAGLMVTVNDHITQAGWCCGANPCDGAWDNDWFGGRFMCRVSQSQAQWINNWETIMRPFVGNGFVIGADLRNEVRGLWGTMYWDRWAAAAEMASERLLSLNPNWLMFVEGISSANDLTGVRTRPIRLSYPDRVVYSAHVYCWSGWGSLQPFAYRTYDSFAATMRDNWAYLLEGNIAPVWVGEFGTPWDPSQGDWNYWAHLIKYLKHVDAGWGYWAINPRKPEGNVTETYGLVEDGWTKVRWDFRLEDLRELGLSPRLS